MATQYKTIAVIDDEPGILKALERLLKVTGYRVRCFVSAEQFLNTSAEFDADCMLLDIELGGTTGIELAAELTVTHPDLPIVFMSGSVCEKLRARATVCCVEYLRKPFTARELLAAITRAINGYPARR
jgi:FixJ family two-component response regulator